jgi:hypothetical protein
MLFFSAGTTPSLTQKPQAPIILASIMSVLNRSPTTAICEGCDTPVSGWLRKYSMISSPQPGFLLACGSTGSPVDFSSSAASVSFLSKDVAPAVLETIRSFFPGYAALSLSKCSCKMVSDEARDGKRGEWQHLVRRVNFARVRHGKTVVLVEHDGPDVGLAALAFKGAVQGDREVIEGRDCVVGEA